jgi:hypothetical protein
VPLAVPLPEAVVEAVAVAEGVQERSIVEPGGQSAAQPQGVQVVLEVAPSAAEKVPAGHNVKATEKRGQ